MKILAAALAVASLTACVKKYSSSTDKASPSVVEGKSSATPVTPAADAEPPADDRCEITVEGDIKDHGFGPGGAAAAASDYWMNEAELRENLASMSRALGEKNRDIDADMKKDPRFYTLLLNCQTPGTHLSLGPTGESKYADIPYGPKKYKIVSTGNKSPGAFQTMINFKERGVWEVDGEGELDVTRFDKTGLSATFTVNMIEHQYGEAKGPPRKAKVTGSFNFKCRYGRSVCAN
jgi:hypothetical protein